jgi:preprotein translocase subunit Sss1
MNKKAIIITAIAIISIGAIAYIETRPAPLSNCDILLTKMLEAKTEAEHEFAYQRWLLICVKPTSQP